MLLSVLLSVLLQGARGARKVLQLCGGKPSSCVYVDRLCLQVDHSRDGPAPHLPYVENTFVISSWAPAAQEESVRGKRPMLVSWNCREKLEAANAKTERPVTSHEAHPCLSKWQLAACTLLWPRAQGSRNGSTYFCGSAVTPGNGHDLSFLSGLVVAGELGAEFPYSSCVEAHEDYLKLRKMMIGH